MNIVVVPFVLAQNPNLKLLLGSVKMLGNVEQQSRQWKPVSFL